MMAMYFSGILLLISHLFFQVIVSPWARSSEHVELYSRTMRRLWLLGAAADPRTSLLLQLVVLFHVEGAEALRLEDLAAVERAQSDAAAMLHAHLRSRLSSDAEAAATLANLILVVHDLRRMADILLQGQA
jgi:hypothetical protein